MNRFARRCVVLVFTLSLTVIATHASETPLHADWSLVQEEGKVKLFTKAMEGSPYLAVKAVATLTSTPNKIATTFGTGEACSEWRAMCKSAKLIEKINETERYIYLVLDLPWPASDRDMIIHSTAEIDTAKKKVKVLLNPAPDKLPNTKLVRAIGKGAYEIQDLGDNQVQFTYTMHTNIGGNLSPRLVNKSFVESSMADMQRFVKLAEN